AEGDPSLTERTVRSRRDASAITPLRVVEVKHDEVRILDHFSHLIATGRRWPPRLPDCNRISLDGLVRVAVHQVDLALAQAQLQVRLLVHPLGARPRSAPAPAREP